MGPLSFSRMRNNAVMDAPALLARDGERQSRCSAWSAYWSTGSLHSCATSFKGDYAGAIGDFWRQVFSSLPVDARVLDLATGNGPLPRLLRKQRGWQDWVEAVDLAEIQPRWHDADRDPRLRFHPGVSLEMLPFADHSFDLVVSQYGFEYAVRERALAEINRVCSRSGSLALVVHHAGSVLAEVAHAEVAHHDWLLSSDGLLVAAREIVPFLGVARRDARALKDNSEAFVARERYNTVANAVQGRIASALAPDVLVQSLGWVHAQLGKVTASNSEEILEQINSFGLALEQARTRSRELTACALDDVALALLVEELGCLRPGACIEVGELRQSEGILGWWLRLKPA